MSKRYLKQAVIQAYDKNKILRHVRMLPKQASMASALTFLYLNGYEIEESYDLELADLVLGFLSKDISKEDLAKHLKENAIER
jgi:hypothetical protein